MAAGAAGFRSGGFNQTGVGAVAHARQRAGRQRPVQRRNGRHLGSRRQEPVPRPAPERWTRTSFTPNPSNGYFFVYIAADSTQNLGNLNATYKGAELESPPRPTDQLDLYASFGYTDSRITAMADPTVVGNQAPLVSKNTVNAGAQYRQPLGDGLNGTVRWTIRRSAAPGGTRTT